MKIRCLSLSLMLALLSTSALSAELIVGDQKGMLAPSWKPQASWKTSRIN